LTTVWTEAAVRHLESAWEYLAIDSPAAAASQIDRILDAVERLSQYPELGRKGRIPSARELVVPDTPFLIAYRIHKHEIQILAVLHGARRWPDHP
jgi:addiction module RelE/StbE family toxin